MAEYEVTGVRWQMGDGLTMEQRTQKAEEFIRTLKVGTPLILAAEPDNPKDCEAIAVYMDYTRRVGYIKHESCKEVKPLLDSDGQCDAVVSVNDGHVTFYVEIPNAPEVIVSPVETTRRLPECPLPQGIGLAFSDEERALQVVAPRLVKLVVSADTAGNLLELAERYMPLSRLSFCREDNFWRDHVLKQLRKACRLKLPQNVKERIEQLRDELHETEGDFHFTDEHLQQQLFDEQLNVLRKQAEGEDGLFAKYEKYRKSQPDIIGSLVEWFGNMPHAELCNYKEHGCLAQRLNYLGVSRQELYEVYAVILLLDKYGGKRAVNHKTGSKKKGGNTSTKVNPKPEKQHGVEYPVFSKGSGVTDDHIKAIYRLLTARGWISTQTNVVDFQCLFSGVSNDCEIIWTGQNKLGDNEPTKLGVSALYVLFKKMFDEKLITTGSITQKVGPILESHFVDTEVHFLKNVSNLKTTSAKANEYINLILTIMRMRPSSEDIKRLLEEDMESKYDKNDRQDLNYRKPH